MYRRVYACRDAVTGADALHSTQLDVPPGRADTKACCERKFSSLRTRLVGCARLRGGRAFPSRHWCGNRWIVSFWTSRGSRLRSTSVPRHSWVPLPIARVQRTSRAGTTTIFVRHTSECGVGGHVGGSGTIGPHRSPQACTAGICADGGGRGAADDHLVYAVVECYALIGRRLGLAALIRFRGFCAAAGSRVDRLRRA